MCGCFTQTIPATLVAEKILPDEKIIFVGNYVISNLNEQNNGLTYTGFMDISVNPAGTNIISIQSLIVNPTEKSVYINENMKITCRDDSPSGVPGVIDRVGIIDFSSLYKTDASSTTTTPSVRRFVVNGTYGFFDNVTGILVDFKADLSRTIYFLSNKC